MRIESVGNNLISVDGTQVPYLQEMYYYELSCSMFAIQFDKDWVPIAGCASHDATFGIDVDLALPLRVIRGRTDDISMRLELLKEIRIEGTNKVLLRYQVGWFEEPNTVRCDERMEASIILDIGIVRYTI